MKEDREHDQRGIYEVVYPCEEIFEKPEAEKREELAKYVRASYGNTAHFGGQCRMGKSIQDGNNTMPVQVIGLNAA